MEDRIICTLGKAEFTWALEIARHLNCTVWDVVKRAYKHVDGTALEFNQVDEQLSYILMDMHVEYFR